MNWWKTLSQQRDVVDIDQKPKPATKKKNLATGKTQHKPIKYWCMDEGKRPEWKDNKGKLKNLTKIVFRYRKWRRGRQINSLLFSFLFFFSFLEYFFFSMLFIFLFFVILLSLFCVFFDLIIGFSLETNCACPLIINYFCYFSILYRLNGVYLFNILLVTGLTVLTNLIIYFIFLLYFFLYSFRFYIFNSERSFCRKVHLPM